MPDWLAGVGGAVAAIVVAATFLWDRRRTAEGRRTELQRERRAQAERITYYLEEGRSAYPAEAYMQQADQGQTPVDAGWFHYRDAPGYDWGHLVLINNSESCAYRVIAHVPAGPLDGHNRGIGVMGY